jgi:hypothetical protein
VAHHDVVVKDNRVYDAFGPQDGLPINRALECEKGLKRTTNDNSHLSDQAECITSRANLARDE